MLLRLGVSLDAFPSRIVGIIHGDCWFCNILLNADNEFRLLDMRGNVDGVTTTNGDPVYDYAKIMQSLAGFDEAIYGVPPIPDAYRRDCLAMFCDLLRARGVDPDHVFTVACALVIGSLWAVPLASKDRVWALVKRMMPGLAVWGGSSRPRAAGGAGGAAAM